MNALLESFVRFLYPSQCRHCGENLNPSEGHYICASCWQRVEFIERPYCETCGYPLDPAAALTDEVPRCRKCSERERDAGSWSFRKARSVAVYDSAAGEALRLLKYSGKTVMAKSLAKLMIEAIPVFFGMEHYDCIVPVPLHKKKRRKRGYNQVELLGRELSRATGIPMETRVLVKIIDTPPQVGLSYRERRESVRGSFDVAEPSEIAGKKALLIDDVFTSGETVNESAKTLASKGKADCVDVLTLLRVVKDGIDMSSYDVL